MERKETEYLVDPKTGSVFRRDVTSTLTEVFATRKSFEDSLEVFMPLYTHDYDRVYVQAKITGRTMYYVHYCPSLKYLAEFKIVGGKKLIPVDPGRGDYVNSTPLVLRNWYDEKGEQYRLFFVHKQVLSPGGGVVEKKAYLILMRKSDNKIYLPPISNIYDDGRICFGNSNPTYRNGFPSVTDYEYFTSSRANFDLAPSDYESFASFDLEGNQIGIIESTKLRSVSPSIAPQLWKELATWT